MPVAGPISHGMKKRPFPAAATGHPAEPAGVAMHTAAAGGAAHDCRISSTTMPSTAVSRSSRPACHQAGFAWSLPSWWRIAAYRSWRWTRPESGCAHHVSSRPLSPRPAGLSISRKRHRGYRTRLEGRQSVLPRAVGNRPGGPAGIAAFRHLLDYKERLFLFLGFIQNLTAFNTLRKAKNTSAPNPSSFIGVV